ncbi:MAG: hypothetical protein ACLS9A_06555 [Clostridia bacterium]
MIGDPRPTTERAMIKEQVMHNFEGLKAQVEKFWI